MNAIIYKIVPRSRWKSAKESDSFERTPSDLEEANIHFPTAGQPAETAARHFAGQADLLLVAVDTNAMGPALRYEPSRGGALFPHLYTPLSLGAVRWVKPLPLDTEGRHMFPVLEP